MASAGRRRLLVASLATAVTACAPQPIAPRDDPPASAPPSRAPAPTPPPSDAGTTAIREAHSERGRISHYGKGFAGRPTASGEPFDPEALTMAHRTLPFGTRVRVTNLDNRRSVEVVVNDRGPFVAGRIADLSAAAARVLDMVDDGVVDAVLEILSTPGRR